MDLEVGRRGAIIISFLLTVRSTVPHGAGPTHTPLRRLETLVRYMIKVAHDVLLDGSDVKKARSMYRPKSCGVLALG